MDYVLEYTVPTQDAALVWDGESQDSVATCEPGGPVTGVSTARLYWIGQGTNGPALHHEAQVTAAPGETDTIHVSLERPYTLYVALLDPAGNESCASNPIVLGPAVTGVEEPLGYAPVREEWYDVHGRRVARPGPVGFFWRVTPGVREKFLFLGATVIKVKEER